MTDNKPTHTVYYSRVRGGDKKDQLTAIGAAFPHSGEGYGLTIDVPLVLAAGDRLVLLKRKDKDAE
jgi:hypothetical protein